MYVLIAKLIILLSFHLNLRQFQSGKKLVVFKNQFLDEKEMEDPKENKGIKHGIKAGRLPLAGPIPQSDLLLCPHDSQSGQQRHNKRDRNIPKQCHQSAQQAVNYNIELGYGLREKGQPV